jgi:probable F420-dependent oxidoreductase
MKVRIGLGLTGLPFADARGFWRFVDVCEESDVDSLWQSDRLVSSQPQLESMSTMAALAGRTARLKFGMSVTVVTFRDPLVLAKECATIDWLSGGRLLPAFGTGPDLAPEWKATGRSPAGRSAQCDEALEIMARLWSEERVSYEGRHYRYTDARIAPRPVQQPLPLWLGGSSAAAIRRTARLGTGWLGGIQTPEHAAGVIAAIRRESAAAGRPIDPDHYGASFAFRFGDWDEPVVQAGGALLARLAPGQEPRRLLAVGDAAAIIGRVSDYCAAGASKFVLRPIAVGEREVMEQTRRLVAEVLPVAHAPGFFRAEPAASDVRR